MGLFRKLLSSRGLVDVIRCEESSYIIWKWHPQGINSVQNRKDNCIRWGSSLYIKEGTAALFVHNQDGDVKREYIEGPFSGVLQTNNLPVISEVVRMIYGGDSPFLAEVYFINMTQLDQVKFAVPYFDVYDSRFLDCGVPVSVRGAMSFKVSDCRDFIEIHGLKELTIDSFRNQIQGTIAKYIKKAIACVLEESKISLVQLEGKNDQICQMVEKSIKEQMYVNQAINVLAFDISVIEIDKSSEGYQKLKSIM